jgi:hypothetical protein
MQQIVCCFFLGNKMQVIAVFQFIESRTMIYALFLLLAFPFFAYTQEVASSDLEKNWLKGSVQVMHSILYDVVVQGDSVLRGPKATNKRFYRVLERAVVFNEWGFITHDSSTYKLERNSYNQENNIIRSELLDSNSFLYRTIYFTYNRSAQLKRELWYNVNNELDYRLTRRYRKGNLVLIKEKDLDFKDKYVTKYSYNALGRVRMIVDFENDTLVSRKVFCYDSIGIGTEVVRYGQTDTVLQRDRYNSNGLLVERVHFDAQSKETTRIEFTFDSEGKLVEENEFQSYRTTYRQYNSEGDEILSVNAYAKGDIEEFVYTYDEMKNWTKMIRYYNGRAISIRERKLIYY